MAHETPDVEEGAAPSSTAGRQRILDATIGILARSGVGGTTFRAVAQAAGVSPGTITYHFDDRDDLIRQAFESVRRAEEERDGPLVAELLDRHGVLGGLARYLEDHTTARRAELVVSYRVYASALYAPELRADVRGWRLEDLLAARLDDRRRAREIAVVIEGILMYAVMNDARFTAAEAAHLLAPHVLGSPAAPS